MAQTPEQTGNSDDWELRMKKAAVATHMSLTFSQAKNVKLLTIFGAIAAFVPPPFGFVTATILVGGYGVASYASRGLSHSFRHAMGYAQPGDFEILGEFNRLQQNATRMHITMPVTMSGRPVYSVTEAAL